MSNNPNAPRGDTAILPPRPNPNDYADPNEYVKAVRIRLSALSSRDDALQSAIKTAQDAVDNMRPDAFSQDVQAANRTLQIALSAWQQNQQLQAQASDDLRNGIALVWKVQGKDLSPAEQAKLDQEAAYWTTKGKEADLQQQKAAIDLKILQASGSPEEQAALIKQKAEIDNALNAAQTDRVKAETAHQDFQNGLDQQFGAAKEQSALDTAEVERRRLAAEASGQEITNKFLPAREKAITDLYGQQIEQAKQAAAKTALDIHQQQIGEIATLREQLAKAIDDPTNPMDPSMATDLLYQKVRGITFGQAQDQANRAAADLYGKALQAGAVVAPGQRYTVGAEPGGALTQDFAKVGLSFPTTELHPMSAQENARLAGVNIDPRQGIPTTPLFGPKGALPPMLGSVGMPSQATAAPPQAGGVPQMASSVQQPLLTLTPQQYDQMARQRAGLAPVGVPR